MPIRVPAATYRLQFGDGVGFEEARRVIPYLDELGVSDLYASPLLAARPGTSGYHVVDPTRLDPALGTREEFDRFTDELRARGMGLLLDVVPNHMAAGSENPWWMDVLRSGRGSAYATFFDIDWDLHDGRILVPALDAPLQDVLARGALAAVVESGEPVVRYRHHVFPIDPSTSAGAETTAELLSRQHYVLAHWREAAEQVNYRRFFDISDLVGLRQEDRDVFEATHAFVLELVREGRVTSLRIDHVDGLRDPLGYLRRLRAAVGRDIPIYVEKILAPGERVPQTWPIQGTTGYEFAATLNDVFVDPDGFRGLVELAAGLTGRAEPFDEVVAAKKRLVLEQLFSGQVRMLVSRLRGILGRSGPSEGALARALVELTARLPVYRTYVRTKNVSSVDRRVFRRALHLARGSLDEDARRALAALRPVLLLERGGARALDLVMSWQQLTGAVAAKGLEDTALFDHPVLTSRNEVGGEPGVEPGGVRAFHERNRSRLATGPHALSTTSTHDSKRTADARSRIDVISELADPWRRTVARADRLASRLWREIAGERVPDRGFLLSLLQDILGAWPLEDGGEAEEFPDRVERFAIKAAREAKVHTSWIDPDSAYEDAVAAFVRGLFGEAGEPLRTELDRFRRRIEVAGCVNSLAQVVLQVAAPGVPDLYQGTERWFLRLVDPDNRTPVDLGDGPEELRSLPDAAGSSRAIAALLRSWRDGRIKLFVTRAALGVRRRHAELFERGSYGALRARGARAENVVVFARRLRARWAVAAAPRLTANLSSSSRFPLGPKAWGTGALVLPRGAPAAWTDVLTGRELAARAGALPLADVFAALPVALLVASEMERVP